MKTERKSNLHNEGEQTHTGAAALAGRDKDEEGAEDD